ncbi:hypothetical protein NDU88_000434 [Pleurodeles waltl]|uniref:Uncharacterized protein n=1 Tax=Pleurodeles waltl TaxID=8319 RepID=A0AAV7TEY9_PLEWA|nr:hypothetical protein NDU88_000434 [Pleurodeles waltl]
METQQPPLPSKTRGGEGRSRVRFRPPPPPIDGPPSSRSPHVVAARLGEQAVHRPPGTRSRGLPRVPRPARNAAAPHTMPLDSPAGGQPPGLVYCACRLRAPHQERPTG